ncbi:MAG: hypothetical protein J6U38_06875 [Clostridia bacterium]|nr:hypothetical protein [Clostridia bacterium]
MNEITTNVGTYADGVWEGSATSVQFSVGGTSKHRRIAAIKVTFDEELPSPTETEVPPPTETEEPTPFERPTTPEEIVNAAYDLAVGETLAEGPYTLTGVVTSVDERYTTDYNNVTVTIQVGEMTDKKIKCFRIVNGEAIADGEGIEVVKVGDTITVTGDLTRYNANTVEFVQGSTLDALDPTGETPVHYETPEEILEAAAALAVGETLEGGPYELTGTVTEIVEEYSDKYGNITFKMSVLDYEIEGYRIKNGTSITAGEGVEILGVGDTVTLKGDIKNYNGTIEFVQNSTLEDIEYIAKVIRASLILQENLDINFRLITDQFDAATDEIGLQVVLNGKTTICEGEADDENDKQYIYTFENITPALMADEMTVTVLVNGEPVHEITYSVAEYCYKLLRQTDNATLKTLLVDLLIYGAKAQLYINHNVENLADKGLTDDELDFATPDDELPELENVTQIAGKIDEEDAIYSFKSVGLNLTDGIIIRVKLVLNEGKEHSAAASLCINSYIDGLLEETSVPGTYYAYAKVDNPTFFDTGIQLRVVNQGELNPSLSHTLYTSAASYCASILAKCADGRITDEALKDIVVALVKYAYSVKAYANIVNN